MTSAGNEHRPAAGTVLWRTDSLGDQLEVALVHRPRYDDWSLPKGKLEPGETLPACAARETVEETGFQAVLGRLIGVVDRELTSGARAGARKVVTYYAGQAVAGDFHPNDEVDELRWLRPQDAARHLTYQADRDVLAAFTRLPAATRTVLLVRHAKAGNRANWPAADDLRPLSRSGQTQADALAAVLPLFGADGCTRPTGSAACRPCRASPRIWCPPSGIEQALTEEGYRPTRAGSARLLDIAAAAGRDAGGVQPGRRHPGLSSRAWPTDPASAGRDRRARRPVSGSSSFATATQDRACSRRTISPPLLPAPTTPVRENPVVQAQFNECC